MKEKILNTLEFDKIKSLLKQYTVSQIGKEGVDKLFPSIDFDEVEELLKETREAGEIIEKRGSSPIVAFNDVRGILARIKLEAVLSMKELLMIAGFLRAVRLAKYEITDGDAFKDYTVYTLASLLSPMRATEEAIFADIISDEEIADSASSKLASIRKQIRQQNESIKDKLHSLMRSLDRDGVLQEGIVTIRNDRYVLPVLATHKGRVPGIVHDQSASGATLFIEPMAVVEINNSIRQLKLDERDEILRILKAFSEELFDSYEALSGSLEILSRLDLIFAKAKFSRDFDCVCPKLNKKGFVDIKNGKHPLLEKSKVVPISVWLGKEFTELLITGPNTGGKTVTLKTIGLFALMTQCGIHLPASEGTQMPVFDEIFADIGDEQSIQQSLSTFSSHMKNIADIMKKLTPDSLVLLDELGAGTDPAEGAALAMSIMEELRKRRVRTVVTSHYAELKAYSLSHGGIENASVEFDILSLKPTYKLMVGVPGNSNAFLISAKLGLEKYLIDRARSYTDEDSKKLDKVLTNAEEYRASAQAKRTEAEMIKSEIMRERKLLEKEKNAQMREREKTLSLAQKEADKIRANALEEVNKVIDELKNLKESAEPSAIFRARELRKKLNSEKAVVEQTEQIPKGKQIKEFLLGMDVFVQSLNNCGTLLSLPNSKGKVQVLVGIVQLEVNASDLTYLEAKKEEKAASIKVQRAHTSVPMSLDVRGQLSDEAVANVDLYLDLAFGRNLNTVTIIHGKGTGALRQAIWEYLRQNKRVKSFRAGTYGEGDAGVTLIELKN